MQLDLTKEEMGLLSMLIEKPSLTCDRSGMITYANQTEIILQKFKNTLEQTKVSEPPEPPKEE